LTPQSGVQAPERALALLYRVLEQQALLLAFMDNFRFIAGLALACIPLVLVFGRVARTRPVAGAH
jgi:hypothetical protein